MTGWVSATARGDPTRASTVTVTVFVPLAGLRMYQGSLIKKNSVSEGNTVEPAASGDVSPDPRIQVIVSVPSGGMERVAVPAPG